MEKITSVNQLIEKYKSGQLTVTDYIQGLLEEIKEKNKDTNAYITITEDLALETAKRLDQKLKNKEDLGALFGVPVSIKDNIAVKDIKMTCASRMLEDFVPPYQASLVDKILAQDAVIIGKTNLDEFAMGSSTKNSYFGVTKNPLDPTRVAGGSSGGAGASVAMDSCLLAVGTDTGGSVRQPATFCGLPGMKPSYGSISRSGVASMANTFDQPGVIGKNIDDMALLLDIMQGADEKDATALGNDSFKKMEDIDLSKMKIAVADCHMDMEMDPDIKKAFEEVLDKLKEKGAQVDRVETKNLQHAIIVYHILVNGEIAPNMSRYDGLRFGHRAKDYSDINELFTRSRSEGFGDEVKRRIMIGTHILSLDLAKEYYDKALQVRHGIMDDYKKIFEDYDVVLSPTYPVKPYLIDQEMTPVEIYSSDLCTVPVNIAGLPAVSIPYPLGDGLYMGLQFTSDHFKDNVCLSYGKALEGMIKNDL